MKKIYTLILCLVTALGLKAQSPLAFSYQAVALTDAGLAVADKPIIIKISLLDGGPTGTLQYQESHNTTTSVEGLFNLSIGQGNVLIGSFSTVNWIGGKIFLKSEYDFNDGQGFSLAGVTQLLSVPYALHSQFAQKALNDKDTVATNEIQNLSRIGNSLSISNGNSILLPDSSQWKKSGNDIFYDNGKVGIGTSTPRSFLDVVSNEGNSQYSINASNTNAFGQAGLAIWNTTGWLKMALLGNQVVDGAAFGQTGEGTAQILSSAGAKDMLVGTLNNQNLILGTNNEPRLHISNAGKIGIGTMTPSSQLTVAGVIESSVGGIKFPDGSIQTSATQNSSSDGQSVTFDKSISVFADPGTKYTRVYWVRLQNNTTDSLIYEFDLSQWYYFALTKKSTGEASIYINGTEMFKGNFANEGFSHNQLNIGAKFFTSYTNFFKGSFDGIRVSNITKSSTEINQYWNSNSDFTVEGNTFALWKFEEGTGTSFASSTGSYTGTLQGNPQWVNGKFGKAVSFDGIDDRGAVNLTLPTANVTYEAWIKFDAPITAYTAILQPYGAYNIGLELKPSSAKNNEGIIMKSANGSCWKLTIDDTGVLKSKPTACPN